MISIRFSDPTSEATFYVGAADMVDMSVREMRAKIVGHVLQWKQQKLPFEIVSVNSTILVPYFMLTDYTIEIKYLR